MEIITSTLSLTAYITRVTLFRENNQSMKIIKIFWHEYLKIFLSANFVFMFLLEMCPGKPATLLTLQFYKVNFG